MHVAVLMKRVPDTATKIKVVQGRAIDEAGVQFIVNPYDEYAIEAGLKLAEAAGAAGKVTVVSVGSKDAQQQMRTALAMGAHEGVHVEDAAQLRDPLALARTLAGALQKLAPAPEVILAGRQSVDGQSMAVGPMVATLMGVPCVTDIVKLEVAGKTARVEREAEGGAQVLEVELPAVFTTNKGLNEPRYASLKGIMAAKKKPIAAGAGPVAAEGTTIRGMAEPPERKGGRIVGEGTAAVPELVRLLREEAKAL